MEVWESLGRHWTRSEPRQPALLVTLIFILSLLSSVNAEYFIINQPSASTMWANGSPYPISWTKGLLDGVDTFDIELTRLHGDGLILVAQNVPATYNKLNILLQDVPEGDDYFLLCFNSTHSIIYSVSSRFTITNSSAAQNPSPASSVPTVTVSGAPNPLGQFATTLGPAANAGSSLSTKIGIGGVITLCAVFLGAVMTFW